MKIRFASCLFAVALALAGCAGGSGPTAAPNFMNGYYYLAGDSTCTQIRQIAVGRVMCVNPQGQDTGYRDAMTDQQIQMWQYQNQMAQQQAAASRAAFAAQLQQTAASVQPYAPLYNFQPPTVAPLVMPGSNSVSCITVSDGFYTHCRY